MSKSKTLKLAEQFTVPLYRVILEVCIEENVDYFNKKYDSDISQESFYAHAFTTNKGYMIALNFNNPYAKMTYGTIAHEAAHVAHYIMHDVGMKPDLSNDESEAYLLGWIVNTIIEYVLENKFKLWVDYE